MTGLAIDQQIIQAKELSTEPARSIALLEEALEAAVDGAYFSPTVGDVGFVQLFSAYYASGIKGLSLVHAFSDQLLVKPNMGAHPLLYAHVLYLKAKAHRYNMEVHEAYALTRQAMQLCEQEAYKGAGYSEMLEGMAYNQIILELYEEAHTTLVQTEALAVANANHLSLARAIYYTAVLNSRLGNLHDSVLALIKTARMVQQHQLSESFLQSCYCDIAVTLNLLGKNKMAVAFFTKAEAIGRKLPVSINFLNVLLRKCIALETVGLLHEVSALLQEFEKDFEACQNTNIQNQYYYFRLLIHLRKGELAACKPYAAQLEKGYANSPEAFIQGNILGGLADYFKATRQYKKANTYLRIVVDNSTKFYNNERSSRMRSMQIQQNIAQAKREKEQAEKIARARQEFLAGMSHEIRSPMNAVIALSSLLVTEPMPAEQKKKVTIIKQASENLLAVVNDILDNAKIESGKFSLEVVDFNLHQLLRDAVELAAVKAEAKGIRIQLHLNNTPAFVSGDPVRLRQVVINLLNNAVKFTPSGSISLSTQAEDADHVKFEVQDTGIGIEAAQLENIFKGYVQAAGNTTRLYGGTGLGLKISRSLVELMGGDLQVNSTPGRGSSFYFSIPLTVASPAKPSEDIEQYVYTGPDNFRFLIADDLPDNRFAYEQLLLSVFPEAHITEAENGAQVLSLMETSEFHLVLMDIDMPLMNGIEACMKIREKKSDVLVLGASANVMLSAADLTGFGFSDFIMKPFTRAQLAAKLKLLLSI